MPFAPLQSGGSSFEGASSPSMPAGHSRTAPAFPPAPTAPGAPAGFGAAVGGGAGFGGGSSAVLVALLAIAGSAPVRRPRCPSVVWRPMAFVSLQEQPG
jgi:hypothetical protein